MNVLDIQAKRVHALFDGKKKNYEGQWMSRSSRGATRVLHCLLVYMMLRHLATVADQINLLI